MIFSIHIPKTAGTSFRKALEERFGDRLAFYYGRNDPKTDPLLRGVTRGELASQLGALEARGVEVLHGHYRFKDIRSAVTDPGRQLWTWVREPVDRVLSHYFFYRERPVTAALGEEVRTGGLSLEDFAAERKMHDVQTRYLTGADITQFGFVGLTERFELGLAMLFGDEAPRLSMRYNATVRKEIVTDAVREKVSEFNARDAVIYAEAVRLVEQRVAALGDIDVPDAPKAAGSGVLARLLGQVA